jgi:hypothetical protein
MLPDRIYNVLLEKNESRSCSFYTMDYGDSNLLDFTPYRNLPYIKNKNRMRLELHRILCGTRAKTKTLKLIIYFVLSGWTM